jgi:hypothetical protein
MNFNGIIKLIKRFRGITVTPLEITAQWFDGYGIHMFTIAWSYKGALCTVGSSKALFCIHMNTDRDRGGKAFVFYMNLLFFPVQLGRITVMPKKDLCENCDDLCETKEFYTNDTPYCCDYCQDKL